MQRVLCSVVLTVILSYVTSLPTPLPGAPVSVIERFGSLPRATQQIAQAEYARIASFDDHRMRLGSSGKFYVVEDRANVHGSEVHMTEDGVGLEGIQSAIALESPKAFAETADGVWL